MSATDTAVVVVGKGQAVTTTRTEAHTLGAWLLRVPLTDETWRTWAEEVAR